MALIGVDPGNGRWVDGQDSRSCPNLILMHFDAGETGWKLPEDGSYLNQIWRMAS